MKTIAVIGLGYVGLGLAVALSKTRRVIGYDINPARIKALRQKVDCTQQVDKNSLETCNVLFTDEISDIAAANFYIVTVSTPAYFYEMPNLEPLINASTAIAAYLKPGDIVVYESTVFPGTTETICTPLLEQISQLMVGVDFNVGYSPERINPGDAVHTLQHITKIISAQNAFTLEAIRLVYSTICDTVYPVSSIKVAESIKVLENTQRDVNIALMNEYSKIMHALNINVHEVITGASTKFGFVPFKPGFVGGHCISIDPHYIAFEAKRHGVQPDLILTARKVNDNMTQFVIQSLLKLCIQHQIDTRNLRVGVLGISYKGNTPDIRNSLSLKLIKELEAYAIPCDVHDPFMHPELDSITLTEFEALNNLSVMILTVDHDYYKQLGLNKLLTACKQPLVLMDIPNAFVNDHQACEGLIYWNL